MTYAVDDLGDLARVTIAGLLTGPSWEALLRAVAREPQAVGRALLLDTRGVEPDALGSRDVYDFVVGPLAVHREVFSERVAVLDSDRPSFQLAQFLEACAQHAGFPLRAFLDESAALRWLRAG